MLTRVARVDGSTKGVGISMLDELVRELGCLARAGVLFMLWGYFDESGEHDATGKLMRLSLAGCIASLEAWREFSKEWSDALAREDIKVVHMVSLASRKHGYKTTYSGWSPERLDTFHQKLVEIMGRHIQFFVGVKQSPKDEATPNTRELYCSAVVSTMIKACSGAQMFYEDNLHVVFANHPELRYSDLAAYCDKVEIALRGFAGVSMLDARKILPLQAADVFAYEFSHCKNWHDITSLSPSLIKLRSGTASFFVWPT